MKWVAVVLLVTVATTLSTAAVTGQRGQPPRTFVQLLRAIAVVPDPVRTQRLAAFVRGRAASDPDTLKARLLVASDHLRGFALAAAAREFRGVLSDLPANCRDLAARALYGLAQCEELLGRTASCIDVLRRLHREFRDLRHARFAAVSLRRLQNPDALTVGRAVPEFEARDVDGRLQSSRSLRGRPALIVFFAPRDPMTVARVTRLLRAFRKGGGMARDAMLFAVERDVSYLRAFLKDQNQDQDLWSGRVLPCTGAFLDPVLLKFSVQALPDSVLIGPDGTLLLRSPTAATLRHALGILVDK